MFYFMTLIKHLAAIYPSILCAFKNPYRNLTKTAHKFVFYSLATLTGSPLCLQPDRPILNSGPGPGPLLQGRLFPAAPASCYQRWLGDLCGQRLRLLALQSPEGWWVARSALTGNQGLSFHSRSQTSQLSPSRCPGIVTGSPSWLTVSLWG